ncbi:DNA integrity scanning protein DisA nucleotide-binding domain protein [Rhizobium sp. C4]|uniref:DNA integrity scanning protein DisA nucleotide-binding domain protein n=1 Tax=Rhizobium sp. C4 TaxID=1349800 RepID=UPI001E3D3063|nr:diadenylate cyclase [Rhizobium sp. C4]MCD2176089.1 diadenylate cyclase [Rhizobium sp. C4]
MMDGKLINLFIWGWQEHFRINLERVANGVFKEIGIKAEPIVLLVGVRREGFEDAHPICIEPEKDRWTVDMFEGLGEVIKQKRQEHPDRNVFHTHPRIMAQQPERILRDAITEAVREKLDNADTTLGLQTFCSFAVPIDKHYVVCAIQVPKSALVPYPTIPHEWLQRTSETNFALSCISAILIEAQHALATADPDGSHMRGAKEVVVSAAKFFMRVSVIPGQHVKTDIFHLFTQLSQLPYEGGRGSGRMVFAQEADPRITYVIRFAEPVSLQEKRWVRKLLEMSTQEMPLIANYDQAFGLGCVAIDGAPMFHIDFIDQHDWLFQRNGTTMLQCRFGEPSLPRDAVDPESFADSLTRLFPEMTSQMLKIHQAAVIEMSKQPHGSMIVIGRDAEQEANRLAAQGTRIAPASLTSSLLNRASKIDGTILVAPDGICHAIGVILDGEANERCTPSRGARYNSAIRYVAAGSVPRVAIVMSDDRTLDVIPLLRPRMSRHMIEAAVAALEASSLDNFHKPRNRLTDLRFYLNQHQCDRINAALARLDAIPRESFELRYIGPRFFTDPAMNDSYLVA